MYRLPRGHPFEFRPATNKVEVGPVFAFDFIEQIHAGVVREKSVFAVVKVEVHPPGGKDQHNQQDCCERTLRLLDAPIGEHHERISHDFCTSFLLITACFQAADICRFPPLLNERRSENIQLKNRFLN